MIAPSGSLSHARILVVDDEIADLNLISTMLQRAGYAVEEAADGAQAFEILKRSSLDLVLLDLNLPDYSGIDILKRIRSNKSTILLPVVIITGSLDQSDQIRAIEEGVTDFIHKPFDMRELTARVRALLSLKFYTDELETAKDVIISLADMVDARDSYTAGHSASVSSYATLLGRRVGLSEKELDALRLGGLFHDIGKIAIPDSVLLKPGKLTPEEFEVIKRHPGEGRRLLRHLRTFNDSIPIVYHHHEKLDGSGYPDGLSGSEISVSVRIASIADVYDALTTDRPYRKALSQQNAFEILSEEASKGWWDRDLVVEFIDVLSKRSSMRGLR